MELDRFVLGFSRSVQLVSVASLAEISASRQMVDSSTGDRERHGSQKKDRERMTVRDTAIRNKRKEADGESER